MKKIICEIMIFMATVAAPCLAWAQVLENASFVGGADFDHARDVAVDAQGNIYIVGGTESPYYPATQTIRKTGVKEACGDPLDIFVVKLDPTGKNVIWSTLVGGPNYERAYAVEVDSQGYVYVAGRAGLDAPITTGSFQTQFQGGMSACFYGNQDGYVFKMTPDGKSLVWASYFGGNDPLSSGIIRDLDVDSQGNVYVVNSIRSGSSYPNGLKVNQVFGAPAGGIDCVIAKVKPDGSQLEWMRYIGGSLDEGPNPAIQLDGQGNAYMMTVTDSSDAPTTANAYDRTFNGVEDFYITKVSPQGAVLYQTFLGGSDLEHIETHNFTVDAAGNGYVGGSSRSGDFPTTPGAYDRTHNGNGGAGTGANTNLPGDAVVAKLSPDGSQLLASTFYGGQFGDAVEGIAVDAQGRVHVTGGAFSSNLPVTGGAHQSAFGGGLVDAFYAQFSNDLTQLQYATYYGGPGNDVGRAAAADGSGNFYAVGEVGGTMAQPMPVLNAFQPVYGGATDGFLIRFLLNQPSGSPPAPPKNFREK